jgi:hypothetical protein
MSKMSEMDMMVEETVEMVEENGLYLSAAMPVTAAKWALDDEEFAMVYREANSRVYG